MATAPARLMTFAEFEQLPDPAAGRYELVHGGLILVPPPAAQHFAEQRQIRRMLDHADRLLEGYADTEFSFRPRGTQDYYVCDVAWVSINRWVERTKSSPYFDGSRQMDTL